MASPNLQTDELLALEERIAILKAVKCPGKTHGLIKSKVLRTEFAKELNDWRNQRKRGIREGLGALSKEEWIMWRGGLESAFWAIQKAQSRAFLYEDRRVAWQLGEEVDTCTPEEKERYAEYEAAVIALHGKTLKTLAQIDADFAAEEFEELTRLRYRRLARDREDAKIGCGKWRIAYDAATNIQRYKSIINSGSSRRGSRRSGRRMILSATEGWSDNSH